MDITKDIENILKNYPHLDGFVQKIRSQRGKSLPEWPDWCFIPLKYWQMLPEIQREGEDLTLVAAATWWYTKGIYEIEENLMQTLINTPIPSDFLSEVFFQLPQWCIYVELPPSVGYLSPGSHAYGFFAFLDENTQGKELLYLLIDIGDRLMPLDFPLDGFLRETMERYIAYTTRQTYETDKNIAETMNRTAIMLKACMAVLLWLCSSDVPKETEGWPVNPKPVWKNGSFRLYAPEKTDVWEMGLLLDLSAGIGSWEGRWKKNEKGQLQFSYRLTNQVF